MLQNDGLVKAIEQAKSAALDAAFHAFVPVTGYNVGVALITPNGLFTGTNVESATLTPTIHAEQAALSQLVLAGRPIPIVCVVASKTGTWPCGMCRGLLYEFNPRMLVIAIDFEGGEKRRTLHQLIPEHFDKDEL